MNRNSAIPRVKRPFPGINAKSWVRYHLRHGARSTYFYDIVRDRSAQASGPFFTDVDGNVLIDFVSNVAASPFGYNHPDILETIKQFTPEDPYRYAGSDFICGTAARPSRENRLPTPSDLHHELAKITKKLNLDCSFLSNSGAEAVENAMKLCFYNNKHHKYFFGFKDGFHGRTLGSLSLTRSKVVHREGFPYLPYADDLPFCACKDKCACGWKIVAKDGKVRTALDTFIAKDIGVIDPKEVAFIMIEPVQGEGGYRIANKNFIKELTKSAKDHDIPIIFDEIQSGMGRTGKWWAAEHFNVKPDVITAAKALRVGATIAKKDFFPGDGRIAGTWAEGNALSTAIGVKTIQMIKEYKLLKNAEQKGKYFLKRLKELNRKKTLSGARGLGLMLGIDVVDKNQRDALVKRCWANGLVIASAGFRSIRFIPPLDVTKREIDIALDIFSRCAR